jgi:hypothetical protein
VVRLVLAAVEPERLILAQTVATVLTIKAAVVVAVTRSPLVNNPATVEKASSFLDI